MSEEGRKRQRITERTSLKPPDLEGGQVWICANPLVAPHCETRPASEEHKGRRFPTQAECTSNCGLPSELRREVGSFLTREQVRHAITSSRAARANWVPAFAVAHNPTWSVHVALWYGAAVEGEINLHLVARITVQSLLKEAKCGKRRPQVEIRELTGAQWQKLLSTERLHSAVEPLGVTDSGPFNLLPPISSTPDVVATFQVPEVCGVALERLLMQQVSGDNNELSLYGQFEGLFEEGSEFPWTTVFAVSINTQDQIILVECHVDNIA